MYTEFIFDLCGDSFKHGLLVAEFFLEGQPETSHTSRTPYSDAGPLLVVWRQAIQDAGQVECPAGHPARIAKKHLRTHDLVQGCGQLLISVLTVGRHVIQHSLHVHGRQLRRRSPAHELSALVVAQSERSLENQRVRVPVTAGGPHVPRQQRVLLVHVVEHVGRDTHRGAFDHITDRHGQPSEAELVLQEHQRGDGIDFAAALEVHEALVDAPVGRNGIVQLGPGFALEGAHRVVVGDLLA